MNLVDRCAQNGWRRIAFVGTTKHAGKTTALNRFLADAEAVQMTIGLCSVGLDGERLDTLIGVEKPAVFAHAGMWLASAERALEQSDATLEWVEPLGIHSPLGEVVLARVLAPGRVLLAGVRQRQHVDVVMQRFARERCDFLLVDGAFDRIAAAAPNLVDAAVLAVGAVSGSTPDRVAEHAAAFLHRFQLPTVTPDLRAALAPAVTAEEIGLLHPGGVVCLPRHQAVAGLRKHGAWTEDVQAIYLPGAVTDNVIAELTSLDRPIALIAAHPVQVLASPAALRAFYRRGNLAAVWHPLPIAAIAINPHHILGHDLPAQALSEAVAAVAGDIPVYNALCEEVPSCGTPRL